MINLNKYSISKYNPNYRDDIGIYTKDEWTSFSDIGKCYNEEVFTFDMYFGVEQKYVNVIQILMEEFSISELCVMELENYNDSKEPVNELPECANTTIRFLSEGQKLNCEEVVYVTQGILRELLWCGFYSRETHLIIKFGYDYYINIISEQLSQNAIDNINKLGLYIENL